SVSLRVGGTLTYTIRFLVAPGAFSDLSNKASAVLKDNGTGIMDPVDNNTGIVGTTKLTPVADLAITMNGIKSADKITYTIKVTNAGPSDVSGAMVKDELPNNFNVT